MTASAKLKRVASVMMVVLLGMALWSVGARAQLAFLGFFECDKTADGKDIASHWKPRCNDHLKRGRAIESNPLSVAEKFPTCTQARTGAKMFCITLLESSKLIQQTIDTYTQLNFPTETERTCLPSDPSNCIENQSFTDAGEKDYLESTQALGVIFQNDGYAADNVVFNAGPKAVEGLPSTDANAAARSDFQTQRFAYSNKLNEDCGAALKVIYGKSDTTFVENPQEVKAALVPCANDVKTLAPALLEALNKLDPGGSAGGGGSGAGAGSVLSLPLPLSDITVPDLIGRVLNALLGVVGSIALLMFVWGGFSWIAAAGNAEKIAKAKQTITWAALGLIAIFGSYAILKLVIDTFS